METSTESLQQEDGIDYLYEHFRAKCGVTEIQEVGGVLDRYLKIGRNTTESVISYEMREIRVHGEFNRVMTALDLETKLERAREEYPGLPAEQRAARTSGTTPRSCSSHEHTDRDARGVSRIAVLEEFCTLGDREIDNSCSNSWQA